MPNPNCIHIGHSHGQHTGQKCPKSMQAIAQRKETKTLIDKEVRWLTSYIKHLAVSGLSSISARIKSTCNLTGKCFEMPNVSYT